MRTVRAVFAVLVTAVTSLALVLAGPVGPALAFAPAPLPVTLPASILADLGIVSASAGSATVAAEGAAVGATVAAGGAATVAGSPILVVAGVALGGLAIGYGLGHFGAKVACAGGASIVCMPKNPEYVPNLDVTIPGQGGWTPNQGPYHGLSGFGEHVGMTATIVDPEPAYGDLTGPNVNLHAQVTSGTFVASGSNYVQLTMRLMCKDGSSPGTANLTIAGNDPGQHATQPMNYAVNCATPKLGFGAIRIFDATSGSELGQWYPVGHPDRPADMSADPLRHWLTRGQCVDGATVTFPETTSADFHETDTNYPVYPSADCPAGALLTKLTVQKITPDLDPETVWEWEAPEDYAALPTTYPECAGAHACLLKLSRILPLPRLGCFNTPEACEDWYTDPDKLDNFECTYGATVIALSECNVYRPTFRTAVKRNSGTETENDPPYADPDGTLPGEDPVEDPDSASCPPDFGILSLLNPFWYYNTSICIAKWAFIPPPGSMPALETDWCETAPGVLSCGVSDVLSPWGALGDDPPDCLGGAFNIPIVGDWGGVPDSFGIYPFQACDPPLTTISSFWIGISSGAIYFGAFLLGAKVLGRTIGLSDPLPES